MSEVWSHIDGSNNCFVSSLGNVKQIIDNYERHLPQSFNQGYCFVSMHGVKRTAVHILVANAFIDNPENKPEVNHKDFNRANNKANNLERVTKKENAEHAAINGRYLNNGRKKDFDSQVTYMTLSVNKEVKEKIEILAEKSKISQKRYTEMLINREYAKFIEIH